MRFISVGLLVLVGCSTTPEPINIASDWQRQAMEIYQRNNTNFIKALATEIKTVSAQGWAAWLEAVESKVESVAEYK